MRILALGDSYTIGEGVDERDRWPVQLAARLEARGTPVDELRIIATTGWTTDELSAAIDSAAPQGEWTLVTLLIGVNDQYRGRSIGEFESGFRSLLETAFQLTATHGRTLVLSIPDWGFTPFAAEKGRDSRSVATEIDAFNAAARAVSNARGALFVDVTPLSREAAHDQTLLAPDRLHFSGRMYARWVDRILDCLGLGLGT